MVKRKPNYSASTRVLRNLLRKQIAANLAQDGQIEFVQKSYGTYEVHLGGAPVDATYIHVLSARKFRGYFYGKLSETGTLTKCKSTIKALISERI